MSAVRVQTDPRITRRRQAVTRSKRKRMLVGAGILFGLCGLVWAMFWSPLLDVRTVKVLGADRTGAASVISATGVADGGENLLLLSTARIASRVQELPWVERATVERILPGTVRVRVAEREPAFILEIAAARWTIDANGNVLAVGKAKRGLPVLSGIEVGHVEPGVRLRTPESLDALRAYEALPLRIRKRVAGVFAPTQERITFSLSDGTEIRYGAARQMKAKGTVLKALLKRFRTDGHAPKYIDVRVPTSPAASARAN